MNITVRTRSQSKLLYERMRKCIPKDITTVAHTGYSSWSDASTFLHDAIENTEGMLLILDEDAYITNWTAVENLIKNIRKHNYTHAGIPDGGIIPHRQHSYLTINPFFAIFDCDLVNTSKKDFERSKIDSTVFQPMMEKLKPAWITDEYDHDVEEPFAGLFYWLAAIGNPFFLRAKTLRDGISTEVIGPDDDTLCLHSWYSRSYHWDPEQQIRIDRIYRSALRQRVKRV